jgi:hypothetical protein
MGLSVTHVEDVPYLMVHLVHPVRGGGGQSVQECRFHGHILAGPSKGWRRRPLTVDDDGDDPGSSSGLCEVNGCGVLHPQHSLTLM